MKEYKSILLAGGFGTRLEEAGLDIPKGLIESSSGTIIGRLIKDLQNEPRITEKILVTNNLFFSLYKKWLQEAGLTDSVKVINNGVDENENRLGAIGDLNFALNETGWTNSDIFVAPSDTLYRFRIGDYLNFCEGKDGLITIVSRQDKDIIRGRLGCAELSGDRVIGFEEKPKDPKSEFAAVPFYVIRKEAVKSIPAYIEAGGDSDAPGSIIPWFIEKNVSVFAYQTTNTLDVGKPEDLPKANDWNDRN